MISVPIGQVLVTDGIVRRVKGSSFYGGIGRGVMFSQTSEYFYKVRFGDEPLVALDMHLNFAVKSYFEAGRE